MRRRHLSERRLKRRVWHLREYPNVLAAFLFGSQVDGCATPESDVDLAVLFERDPVLSGGTGPGGGAL